MNSNGVLNFDSNEPLKLGYRLKYLEVYNWGTFHGRIWRFDVNGESALMTGDNGAGKSTLIDAITTLLVPQARIKYNGQDKDVERNLNSYVMGFYKNEADSQGRPVGVPLRGMNDHSVILVTFVNEFLGEEFTLAKVFTPKENETPDTKFITAERAMTIKGDFTNFGQNISTLWARLKNSDRVTVHPGATSYNLAFRQKFGIEKENSMELFNHTVTMKSIESVTDFLRKYMLRDQVSIKEKVQAIIEGFMDLEKSHNAVVDARNQIDILKPIYESQMEINENKKKIALLEEEKKAVAPYFFDFRIKELNRNIVALEEKRSSFKQVADSAIALRARVVEDLKSAERRYASSGGDRVELLNASIVSMRDHLSVVQSNSTRLRSLLNAAQMAYPESQASLTKLQQEVLALFESEEKTKGILTTERNTLLESRIEQNHLLTKNEKELDSLKNRTSSIGSYQMEIRAGICKALGLEISALPYVAELIQVKDKEAPWRGAIERLLHEFGNSMMVSDKLFPVVSKYINNNNLQKRLTFYETEDITHQQMGASETSVLRKLDIKDDPVYAGWLRYELNKRFDYTCVKDMEEYRQAKRGLTMEGMYKSGNRNVKDDRTRLTDASQYILGWNNEDKIKQYREATLHLRNAVNDINTRIKEIDEKVNGLNNAKTLTGYLENLTFKDIDVADIEANIHRASKELDELINNNKDLLEISHEIARLEQDIGSLDVEIRDALVAKESSEKESIKYINQRDNLNERLESYSAEALQRCVERIGNRISKNAALANITDVNERQHEVNEAINLDIKRLDSANGGFMTKISGLVSKFASNHKNEANNLGSDPQHVDGHIELYHEIIHDRIYVLEEAFRSRMKVHSTQTMSNLHQDLDNESDQVKNDITQINKLVSEIDYGPGHYVKLVASDNKDAEVAQFKSDLNACMDDATGTDTEEITEERFMRVKALIDRLRGRPESPKTDKAWRDKVTDVRQWFNFGAQEYRREDNEKIEFYSDSNGKSNGQKEKLAYTILGASLSHRYGLDKDTESARNFRLVIVDEAFSNASPETAHYGLELFKRLKFQMVVATPMSKIDVIEPFVSQVGHAALNANKDRSSFVNLTIDQYRSNPAYIAAREFHEATV